jgi:hypothetical protein
MNRRKCAMVVRVLMAAAVMATASVRRAPAQALPPELEKALAGARSMAPLPSPLAEAKTTDDTITRLRKERYLCAYDELKAAADAFRNGTLDGPPADLWKCFTDRHLEAELALCKTPDDRVSTYSRALPFAKGLEELSRIRFNTGRAPIQDVKKAQFTRLDIEIKLLEAKDEAAKTRRK